MKGQLTLYYDQEGDFLEIAIGKQRNGKFKAIEEGIFERIDETTKEVIGVAIMGFKKRVDELQELSLPISIELSSI